MRKRMITGSPPSVTRMKDSGVLSGKGGVRLLVTAPRNSDNNNDG